MTRFYVFALAMMNAEIRQDRAFFATLEEHCRRARAAKEAAVAAVAMSKLEVLGGHSVSIGIGGGMGLVKRPFYTSGRRLSCESASALRTRSCTFVCFCAGRLAEPPSPPLDAFFSDIDVSASIRRDCRAHRDLSLRSRTTRFRSILAERLVRSDFLLPSR